MSSKNLLSGTFSLSPERRHTLGVERLKGGIAMTIYFNYNFSAFTGFCFFVFLILLCIRPCISTLMSQCYSVLRRAFSLKLCSLCVKVSQIASKSSSKWWLLLISRWDHARDPRLLLEMAPLRFIPQLVANAKNKKSSHFFKLFFFYSVWKHNW